MLYNEKRYIAHVNLVIVTLLVKCCQNCVTHWGYKQRRMCLGLTTANNNAATLC